MHMCVYIYIYICICTLPTEDLVGNWTDSFGNTARDSACRCTKTDNEQDGEDPQRSNPFDPPPSSEPHSHNPFDPQWFTPSKSLARINHYDLTRRARIKHYWRICLLGLGGFLIRGGFLINGDGYRFDPQSPNPSGAWRRVCDKVLVSVSSVPQSIPSV